MNLGNQNSKYSWRIRDLENPQTGTQFANSVMYKIHVETQNNIQVTGTALPRIESDALAVPFQVQKHMHVK